MRRRQIVVFLNNKLITCDTIVPLMIELAAKRPSLAVEFAVFEENTHDVIQRNTVLLGAINSVGRLVFRGRRISARQSLLQLTIHRVRSILWLLGLLVRALAGWVSLVHFKSLNQWPLRAVGMLASQHTFFFEPSAIGYAPLEKRASELMKMRKYDNRRPVGKYLVGFSKYWPPFTDVRLKNTIKKRLPPPFTSRYWIKYLDERRLGDLASCFEAAGIPKSESLVLYILAWMGPTGLLRERDLFPKLYEETLQVLAETCPQLPIFIKPHPAMRADERRWVMERALSYQGLQVVVTDLHPMLLAQSAKFAIGNCYSTAFSSIHYLGVPTIEYTNYSERILQETNGGSMRPEYVTQFISRNPNELRLAVHKYVQNDSPRMPVFQDVLDDPELISALAGSA